MEINHVLIVEDDKEIREGVQIYLQSQGYVVFQAADGIEGLEILERGDPSGDHRYYDAAYGRDTHDDETKGEIRFSGYHVICQIRGGR